MPMLKVLHVNTERTWRGGEQQTAYLMEGLRQRGHSNLLIAKEGSVMAERAAADGFEVLAMRMRGEVDLSVPWRIKRLVRDRGIDILHAHTSHGHVYIQLAGALLGSARPPVIVHRRVDFSIFRRSFFRLNRTKYLYGVDRYITVSHAIRRVLIADGIPEDRITTVHSGIDMERIQGAPERRPELRAELGVGDDETLIANVAHCADHKGQTYLVQAAPKVLAQHPKARFVIVGDGELRDALMAEAESLGVAERFIFPGFREDVPALLKAFDIFVMPSHMEGLGTSVLDALCAQLPTVGTEAGGMPEMFEQGQNGLVCPIRDPEAISAAICRFLDDPAAARLMGKRGHETVAKGFSRDAMVEGNIAVYKAELARRGV